MMREPAAPGMEPFTRPEWSVIADALRERGRTLRNLSLRRGHERERDGLEAAAERRFALAERASRARHGDPGRASVSREGLNRLLKWAGEQQALPECDTSAQEFDALIAGLNMHPEDPNGI